MISILAAGDITKRREIGWGYPLKTLAPYIEYAKRQMMFRETVISFGSSGAQESEACRACKKSAARIGAEPNCKSCDAKGGGA